MGTRRRGTAGTVAWVVAVMLAATPAAADPPYPASLPDFAHPEHPHHPLYNPWGGTLARPTLVVHVRFSDQPGVEGHDEPWLRTRYFGPGPLTVAGWYAEQSFGRLAVNPLRQDAIGRDGVVTVDVGSSAGFFMPADLTDPDPDRLAELRLSRVIATALRRADTAGVDFRPLDRDEDGYIQNHELLVVVAFEPAPGQGGGAVRRGEDVRADDKTLRLDAAIMTTENDLMTVVHEVGHGLTGMRDFYGFGVGSLALAGPSGGADTEVHGATAYEKLHLGWLRPTVATRDGYRTIRPAHRFPDAFLLYDPLSGLGSSQYLLVENRVRDPESYDRAASGTGLAIWRINDLAYNSGPEHIRPLELLRADGRRNPGCADPDLDGRSDEDPAGDIDRDGDPDDDRDGRVDEDGGNGRDDDGDGRTDEDWPDGRDNDGDRRTDEEELGGSCYEGDPGDVWTAMGQRDVEPAWTTGTPSRLAVRAIERPASDGSVRAFLDVRGPHGVLVDCFTTGTGTRQLRAGQSTPLTFRIRNTGETADTFRFSAVLPDGFRLWPSAPATRTLGPGQEGLVGFTVTPPPHPPHDGYTMRVDAVSTTAGRPSSSCTAPLEIVRDRTTVRYTGATREFWGRPAGFAATVRDERSGTPVSGARVTFQLWEGFGPLLEVTATTDGLGVARADPLVPASPSVYHPHSLRVSVARSSRHEPSSAGALFEIRRRPVTIAPGGDRAGEYSDPLRLSATLTDGIDGTPLDGREVEFRLGPQEARATTDGEGRATEVVEVAQPAADVAAFTTTAYETLYDPGFVAPTVSIAQERLTRLTYVGDSVTTSRTPLVRVVAEQEDDGTPADLELATLGFKLHELLGGDVVHSDETTVEPDGGAVAPLPVLEPDVYTVDAAVPGTNGFFRGSFSGLAELVVVDQTGAVSSSGGCDGGKPVGLTLKVSHTLGFPSGTVRATLEDLQFTGTSVHWIVVREGRAVVEATGTYDGEPAVLRAVVEDAGDPGAGVDTIDVRLRRDDGSTLEPGPCTLAEGDVRVTAGLTEG